MSIPVLCILVFWFDRFWKMYIIQSFALCGKFFSIFDEDTMWLSFHSQYFYVSLYNSKLILYSGFSYQFLITALLGILVKFLHFYTFIFLFLYSCEVSLSFLSFFLQTIFNILLTNEGNQSVHNNHCHYL